MTPYHKELYPADWKLIADSVKNANGWRCLACGKQCRRPGELWLGWEYVLTVAHLDLCYDAPYVTVAALCLPCHLKMDAPLSWWARRRHEHVRRRLAGQLYMFPVP